MEEQFNKAYQSYASGIFRYIYFKVSDYDIASDLTADTFTRFWKVMQSESITNKKAFIYSVAKGIVIDYYRKKKNKKSVKLEKVDERLLSFTDTNEEKYSIKQEIEQVFVQLNKIKKEYQEILVLYYIEELKVKEISFIINKSENNTRVLLHRAVNALKKLV